MMRLVRLGVAAAVPILVAGCYTLQPAMGVTPEIGQELAFDINDVGRVALGGSMGPEIERVEGRLVSRENSEYLVAVTGVQFLHAGYQPWRGEQVRIKSDYVGSTYARQFSKGRTVSLGAVGIAGFAYIVTRKLVGSNHTDPPTPPDGSSTLRMH